MTVQPVPKGYHTVTPYLIVDDVAELIEFLQRAFDAEETERIPGPDGSVMHAEVRIGDSMVMLGAEREEWKAMPSMIHLYVPDADAVYAQAIAAGATSVQALADQFYGDRSGGVRGPQGNLWWISTHVEDVSPEEMEKRMAAAGPEA